MRYRGVFSSRNAFVFLSWVVLISVSSLILLSCVTSSDNNGKMKDGKLYGVTQGLFNHKWWNYFERGISWTKGAFYDEAEADFKAAASMRESDQRQARTYGMHFVDYFPHRELGIVYYESGRYKLAVEELERSLRQEESGRAKYYLNKARKALVEAEKLDKEAPVVQLASLDPDQVMNSFSLDVSGVVEDDSFASSVSINEKPLFIELSAKRIPFSKKIKLKKGLNEIKVSSRDLLGRTTVKEVKVFADFQGPSLNLKDLYDGQQVGSGRITLNGARADASGIAALTINDQVLSFNKEKEVEFAYNLDLEEGENRIILAATDITGNTTTGELNLVYVPQLAGNNGDEETSEAFFDDGLIRLAFAGSGILDTGQNLFLGASTSRAPSRIRIKDLTETQTVYFETMYIDGSASGAEAISSVAINGEPITIVPGNTVYFNQLFDLQEGENDITFEVTDKAGRTASEKITVVRVIPKVHQVGSRMNLAILPFEIKGEDTFASETLVDNLISSFVNQDRFNLVSRGSELEAVLREQKLSATDLVDQKTAVRIGRLVAAEMILVGTIRETPDSIEVYARMINTETSAIMSAKDVYGQDKGFAHIQYLMDGLALKFKHEFPLLEGMVIKASGKEIFADFGKNQRVKKDMKFIVFREGEPIVHPITGKVLGSDTEELGVATVAKVFDDLSMGKLTTDFDPSAIKVQDLIIMK